jgi:RNA polymerase sigma factor (sigma-70 family)
MDVVTDHEARRTRTDAELIVAARRSPDQFAAVFDRHYGRIYAYVARRLGRDLAEDVASETFLVAFSRLAGYDPARPDAAPWLYGIASNLIARHGRAESRRYRAMSKVPPERPVAEIDVAGRLDAATARGRLAAALGRLAGPARAGMLLVAGAGLSQPEVAAALDVPAGTVRSRLHRARREMRTALGEEDAQ